MGQVCRELYDEHLVAVDVKEREAEREKVECVEARS